MDIDNIVENACARATIQFQKDVEKETQRLIEEKDYAGVWANIEAVKLVVPDLVKNAIKLALMEIYKKEGQ